MRRVDGPPTLARTLDARQPRPLRCSRVPKDELDAAAADSALALPQPGEPQREVRLHAVVVRVRLQAVQLVAVTRQVVQLLLAGHVLGVEPVRRADARVRRRLEQDVPPRLEELVLRERDQRPPVHDTAGLSARRLDDRRREVDVRDELRAVLPGRDPGPAHEQRDADRRLVEDDLALLNAVLAVHEAVVRGEDDVACCRACRSRASSFTIWATASSTASSDSSRCW